MYTCIVICVALIATCVFLCKYISIKYNPSLYEMNDTRLKDVNIIVSNLIDKLNDYEDAEENEKHKYYVSPDETRNALYDIYYITEEK